MATKEGAASGSWWSGHKAAVSTTLTGQPAVIIPILEYVPEITRGWQVAGILSSAIGGIIGLVWMARRGKRLEAVEADNDLLRNKLSESSPEELLSEVAKSLFQHGAWRLSVFRKTHDSEAKLIRVAAASSDVNFAEMGPCEILIRDRTQFAHVFTSNLADPQYRFPVESGHFAAAATGDAARDAADESEEIAKQWIKWRDEIFGIDAIVDDRSTFRPHKFAWYAAQDPESSGVYLVLAESAESGGIRFDVLKGALTSTWMFFVPKLTSYRDATGGPNS